jgi:L-lactate oxidase
MATNRRGFLGAATAIAAAGTTTVQAAAPAGRPPVPSLVGPVTVINLRELEARAQAVLPKGEFDYIAGGSGDEWTKAENEAAFKRITIAPRFLGDHRPIDASTTLLGQRFSSPIFVCPMGGHGMAHTSAEAGTAQGVAAEGALLTVSAMSTLTLEDIAKASPAPKWLHFYVPDDPGLARSVLARAKAAGYRAIVFNRERNLRNNFSTGRESLGNYPKGLKLKSSLGWDDVAFVQKESGLPVIIKGVLNEAVAAQAARSGVAGIQVSNHGGRALDDSPATITILPRMVQAADGRLTILIDSGVRRGQDVFKALALGAHGVGVGRPILYGLALGGAPGVQAVLARIKAELEMTMRACATPTVADIDRRSLTP